jgi:hypothetical protein
MWDLFSKKSVNSGIASRKNELNWLNYLTDDDCVDYTAKKIEIIRVTALATIVLLLIDCTFSRRQT